MRARPPDAFSETLPAVPQSVPELRAAVARFAAEAGVPGPTLEHLMLAVSEAVTNVTLHAYADRDAPGSVTVVAVRKSRHLHVTVSDAGIGMRPRLDSPGLGLGLALIAHSAETFDVHRSGSGGTELQMSFPLDTAPEY